MAQTDEEILKALREIVAQLALIAERIDTGFAAITKAKYEAR